ncbi:MAG TPA: asparagine synthase (glutamine-hydrolyzing) [bacterium]
MCGFAGMVHWDAEPIPPDDPAAMADILRHRGPDERVAASPEPGIALAHARLKVIDLSDAARQPMADTDSKVWLVYNGEIYNFRELRSELAARGHRFHSASDTEVVLRGYLQWGPDVVRRLDGMFALAVWDGGRRTLLLARDRIGKKPLFYWTDGTCLTFGSEIKALLAHAHVPCDVDESALPGVLAFGHAPEPRTAYRGIREVPPATMARFGPGASEPVLERYWRLEWKTRGPVTDQEAAGRLRELLAEAVRRRLVADVPVGAFLSGGVDSSIVTALMSSAEPARPVRTFSIAFPDDPRYDESRYAEAAARRVGALHTTFPVGPQPIELVERLVRQYDQPFGDTAALPLYLLSELARRHVTVALTGDGGDELFAGYDRMRAALWAERMPRAMARLAARAARLLPDGHERSLAARVKRFARSAERSLPEAYLEWTAYVRDPWAWLAEGLDSVGTRGGLSGMVRERWAESAGCTTLGRLLHLNFTHYLPSQLLVKADRCSMAHGLELRSPMLDTALIEFAAALPDRMRIRAGRTKWLLRRACADLIPPETAGRGKAGFGVPVGAWFRGSWRDAVQDLLGSGQAEVSRYANRAGLLALLDAHCRGRVDAGGALWVWLTTELWLRQTAARRKARRVWAHAGADA